MQRIDALFRKFLTGHCSPEEAERLIDFFSGPEGDAEIVRLIEQELDSLQGGRKGSKVPFATTDNLEKLRGMIGAPKRKPIVYRLWPYAAAVVLALAVGIWGWPWLNEGNHQELAVTTIAPGGNRATLTLADGRTVALSEAQNGIKVGNEVVYTDGTAVEGAGAIAQKGGGTVWMSLATPRGGTYQVTLPDGSRVWLNAASTLKYPSRFDGAERVVELDGEGYFEVEKDSRRPFRVVNERQEVVVLGTAFNIASYRDEEETRTTLVEGKVSVSSNLFGEPVSVVLSPSEQARLVGGRLTKNMADVTTDVAWRDGLFAFRSEKLGDIMRQVARWYDVEVVFEGDIANRSFSGTVSRYAHIHEMLETLALTDRVRFVLNGKTIVVKSK
ncbi:FecR family protein [Parapedobacter deserti]|uniref:FecR family protein n=1 Tax=Parapedobacter deserti TaxID=1912957 RepID=A0ABV7JX97_9SPHI